MLSLPVNAADIRTGESCTMTARINTSSNDQFYAEDDVSEREARAREGQWEEDSEQTRANDERLLIKSTDKQLCTSADNAPPRGPYYVAGAQSARDRQTRDWRVRRKTDYYNQEE